MKNRIIKGIIDFTKRGSAYVITDESPKDVFISADDVNKSLNGDKVRVEIFEEEGRSPKGRVIKVIGQSDRLFTGILDVPEGKRFAFLVLDDQKINLDFLIPRVYLNGGKAGDKAIACVTDWPDSSAKPIGKIVEVLGKAGSNDAEVKGILSSYGIEYTFPEQVLSEANQISTNLPEEEIAKRRDFRSITTITIDPVSAKDFDDALSIEALNNGNMSVGIHIADVSHYVKENTALDEEAAERGNSVYLVDRVIPMLPEHLSNGVCSLRPNEEKFTFGAVFELTEEGELISEWFGKTVIKSDRRFAYHEVQEIIDGNKGDFRVEVLVLDVLAKKMRAKRISDGAVEMRGSEIRFILAEDGKPIDIIKKTQTPANELVEEFMLLANKRVGRYIGKRKKTIPSIYRVHDRPNGEKVKQLADFLSKLGRKFDHEDEDQIAHNLNQVFEEMKDEKELPLIQQMAMRAMAKAVYAVDNIGHYGLGFEYYTHFTSPIRRYADLMVHRVLFNELTGEQKSYPDLSQTASHISKTERSAMKAERSSRKFFQASFLQGKEGEEFSGTVSGFTSWGMYVEMENYCEGAVAFRTMSDYYVFDRDDYVVRGERTGKEFKLGDTVRVRITGVSVPKREVDLELMEKQ